jgi:hypothetical protein
MLALSATTVAGQSPACDKDAWRSILAEHAVRYPLMTDEDMYKLIHQGVFGSEHAAPDEASARAWLTDELAGLGAGTQAFGPVVESIAPEVAVVRVHLQPFVAGGGDVEALLAAFLETASSVRGDVAEFRCVAEVVPAIDPLRWPLEGWRAFVGDLIARGLPAVHHSTPFNDAYAPAYRVVAGELVAGLIGRPD